MRSNIDIGDSFTHRKELLFGFAFAFYGSVNSKFVGIVHCELETHDIQLVIKFDAVVVQVMADLKYNADAITNKHLQKDLSNTEWANGMTGKRLSGKISRNLKLLRVHGVIKKLPNQHRYMLTDKGRLMTMALSQMLGVKIDDLVQCAA
ncbi:MAG: hypothetical protein LBU32_04010 [Clostridiales bacterium]|nr:hypothetical protein [Clostridiales bacterium]